MFETGLRNAECRNLQRRHILLGRGELVVYQGKGDKDRIVPLNSRAQKAIADLDLAEGILSDHYLWYSRPGGGDVIRRSYPIGATTFARWYRACLEAASVAHRKPHMTRHTRATRMRRMGYALDEIQLFLGHSSSQTTRDLYVHTDIYDVARRMAELEGTRA
jgi:integrase